MFLIALYYFIIFLTFSVDSFGDGRWTEHNGVFYSVLRDDSGNPIRDTAHGARQRCINEDSIIWSPTAQISTWVIEFLNKNNLDRVWFGINDERIENNWEWSDGSNVNDCDIKWLPGEPNDDGSEDCVEIQSNGALNDLSCVDTSSMMYMICQKCKPCDVNNGNSSCETPVDNLHCHSNITLNWEECVPDCIPGPADVLFVVDTSSSVTNTMAITQNVMKNIIQQLTIGPNDFQAALITYNYEALLDFDFTTHTSVESLEQAFEQIDGQSGPSFTGKALTKAQKVFTDSTTGSRRNAYKYIILITDGLSTDSNDANTIADTLRKQRIKVMSISVGESISHADLSKLSYNKQFTFSHLHYKDAYNKLLQNTIDNECTDCALKTETDILILLDTQKSQSPVDFRLRRNSIRPLLENTMKDNTDIQVGLITFSDHPDFKYNLTWSNDLDVLIAASFQVEMKNVSVKTNITHALEFIYQSGFSTANGGRTSSRKLVFVLSNGNWSITDNSETVKLHNNGIEVFAIEYGNDLSIKNIQSILYDPVHAVYVPQKSKSNRYESFNVLPALLSYYDCFFN